MDGIGIHWYNDPLGSPNILENIHKIYGDKYIFITESSLLTGANRYNTPGPHYGHWSRNFNYLDQMFEVRNTFIHIKMEFHIIFNFRT